jgi:hypothetical protein
MKNLKHIFPDMKLCGLVPNLYIHVSGSKLYIPTIGLIWNLYFPVLHQITHINDQHTNFLFGKLRIINGNS